MEEMSGDCLPYRTRFIYGSCWPAFIAFCGIFLLMFVEMYGSGYFGNPRFTHHELGEWKMIMFPIMAGSFAALVALGGNAALFSIIRPKSKKTALVIGLGLLPMMLVVCVGIKCLL